MLQQRSTPPSTFQLHHLAPAFICLVCRLLKSTKDYELRIYDVYPFATTLYERRDEGFLALGSYMEGHNSESARMNLTQPIVMRYEPATVSAPLSMLAIAGVLSQPSLSKKSLLHVLNLYPIHVTSARHLALPIAEDVVTTYTVTHTLIFLTCLLSSACHHSHACVTCLWPKRELDVSPAG